MEKNRQLLLVERAAKGNRQALAELCEGKALGVLFVCTKMMGNQHDGEDAAQEVFLRLHRHIGKLKNPASFSVWLHRMVLNTCNSMRVKNMQNRTDLSMEEFGLDVAEGGLEFIPQAYLEQREKRAALDGIINGLPASYRMCILLYYFESMSYEEIAQVLDISTKAVSNNLYRAKLAIRREISRREGADLLCQAPLAAFFLQCAQDSITPAAVAKCVAIGAGAAAGAAHGVLLPLIAGLCGVAATATMLVFLARPVTGTSVAFTPSAGPGTSWEVPQQPAEPAPADGVEDRLQPAEASSAGPASLPAWNPSTPEAGAGRAETSPAGADTSPGSASGGPPASSSVPVLTPPTQAPEPPPAPQPGRVGALATPLFGQLQMRGSAGEVLAEASPYLAGTEVRLYNARGGLLDEGRADGTGRFALPRLHLEEAGTYTLEVTLPGAPGLAFAADNPDGRLLLSLVPGKAPAGDMVAYVVDTEPPSLGVALYGPDGARSQTDPARAAILAGDSLPVTCTWEIAPEGGGALYSGEGTEITAPFTGLAPGLYRLAVQARDAAGNASHTSTVFLIT